MGNICVEMRETARFVANMASQNQPCMVALIADQSPKRKQIKHYVKFLNHTVSVLVGPEKITNCPTSTSSILKTKYVDSRSAICGHTTDLNTPKTKNT